MPNKTVYLKDGQVKLWEKAKQAAMVKGYDGISDYLLNLADEDIKNTKWDLLEQQAKQELEQAINKIKGDK